MIVGVPSFSVYGEPDRPLDLGFMHVETVMERGALHRGRVAAHKHDQLSQLTYWMRGRGEYFIEDRRLDFIAPAVSFMPSGVVHGFTITEQETDATVVSIADDGLALLRPLCSLPLERPVFVECNTDEALWWRLKAVMADLLRDYRAGFSQLLPPSMALALNQIALLVAAQTGAESSSLALAFKALVEQQFRENWSINQYVRQLATTPHLLAKASQEAFGLPVKTYIDSRRLLEAKRLLLFTVRSVESIAYELGFRDPAYFSRFFRQRAGMPPGEWRLGHSPANALPASKLAGKEAFEVSQSAGP